jgi:uncharacterized RDD family membrane protein YckC
MRCFQGEIDEVLVYDTNLSDADRAAVFAYLKAKWPLSETRRRHLPSPGPDRYNGAMDAREPEVLTTPPGVRPSTEKPHEKPGPDRPTRPRLDDGPIVHVAGFWRRLAASLVDLLVAVPIAFILAKLAGRVAGIHLPPARRTGLDYWLDLALAGDPALWGGLGLGAAIVALYLYLFQVMAGRTPGMRLLRMRVIDLYGDPPSAVRAGVRVAGYLASVCTLSLGFLWIGFDREKRGLHDWLAGTYVVKQ